MQIQGGMVHFVINVSSMHSIPPLDSWQSNIYSDHFITMNFFPGRKIRAGSGRKAPEVTGTWKQYSNRKIFGFFPMISDRFLLESTGNWSESTGKKSNKFPVGILLPLPAISGAFLWDPVTFPHLSCRIMWDPVAGMFDLGLCTNEKQTINLWSEMGCGK